MQEFDEEFKDDIERAPPWLISFGDVTALVLAFFVMLFAMSNPQSEKWEEVISLIATRMNPDEQKPEPTSDLNVPTIDLVGGLSPEYLERILSKKFAQDDILQQVIISGLDEWAVLSLPADRLFVGGSAELNENAQDSIRRLTEVLGQFGNQIDIVGHTDPGPLSDDRYPSRWDLTLARALSVANALESYGYNRSLSVLGAGDSRFRFLDSELSEPRRYELARRVDLIIKNIAGGQP